METLYLFAPITKREETDDGFLIVHGKATGPDLDLDQQICDPDWLARAMPEWFESGGNIREMHQPKAAGIGVDLEPIGDDWQLASKIIDADAITKCREKVYKGYSIGIKNARVVRDAKAPNGRIIDGDIIEVSLVDRPANPTAKLVAIKAAGGGVELVLPDDIDGDDAGKAANADDDTSGEQPEQGKRDYSDGERKDMAGSGQAMPGGGFPIKTTADLKNAIRSIGRAKNPGQARAHIKRRAKALGKENLIPDSWKAAAPDDEYTHDAKTLQQIRQGLVDVMQGELDELCDGENELWDVAELLQSLSMFLAWWQREADTGEAPDPAMPHIDTDDPLAEPDDAEDDDKSADADITKSTANDPAPAFDWDEVQKRITEAVTQATEGFKAALAAQEAELAKVAQQPMPGGPARTGSNRQKTVTTEVVKLQAELAEKRRLASVVGDPIYAQGLRAQCQDLEEQLGKLTTAD